MNDKVFKSLVVNFEFAGEIASIECTPRYGNLRIIGTGANNSMDFHMGCGDNKLKVSDLDNFIEALRSLRLSMSDCNENQEFK